MVRVAVTAGSICTDIVLVNTRSKHKAETGPQPRLSRLTIVAAAVEEGGSINLILTAVTMFVGKQLKMLTQT